MQIRQIAANCSEQPKIPQNHQHKCRIQKRSPTTNGSRTS